MVRMTSTPWHLRACGCAVLYRARADLAPPGRRAAFRGGAAALLLLRYRDSPVGPYHELLYVGGFFAENGAVRPSVTRILVDGEASARAGRDLWGLPKELARFDWQDGFVRVEQEDRLVAEFAWRAFGPRLPALSAPVPRAWRTLAQPWQGRTLFTGPRAAGWLRPARLTRALVNPALFPDVGGQRPLLTLAISDLRLLFPAARVGP